MSNLLEMLPTLFWRATDKTFFSYQFGTHAESMFCRIDVSPSCRAKASAGGQTLVADLAVAGRKYELSMGTEFRACLVLACIQTK